MNILESQGKWSAAVEEQPEKVAYFVLRLELSTPRLYRSLLRLVFDTAALRFRKDFFGD